MLENLKLGAYLRKDKAEIEKDLKWVYELFPRLEERNWQSAGTLSGGEQQMLAVGAALWAGGTVSSIPLSSSSASRAEMACTLELHPVTTSSSAVSAPEKPTRSIPYRSAMACRTDGAKAR